MLLRIACLCALVLPSLIAPALGQDAIDWQGPVAWLDFPTALQRAKAEGRSVCVVVYANWCPKCRALAPQFKQAPLADASKQVLMVLANHDERPEWLERQLGDTANYVPRLYFLDSQGKVMSDLVSGNEKFPHFWHPSKPEAIGQAIATAAGRAGGPVAAPVPNPPALPVQAPVPAKESVQAGSPAAREVSDGTRDLLALGLLAAMSVGAVWWLGQRK
jgi:hypothetical protein